MRYLSIFLMLKYQYLASIDGDPQQRIDLLQLAWEASPTSFEVQSFRLREAEREGNVGQMYEMVGNWLSSDPKRRHLPFIKRLFDPSTEAQ